MLSPEKKFELIKVLIENGVEVRTYYKPRRIVKAEKVADNYIIVSYENGNMDKIHMRDFSKRRFIAII
jgi:hypothetical protein